MSDKTLHLSTLSPRCRPLKSLERWSGRYVLHSEVAVKRIFIKNYGGGQGQFGQKIFLNGSRDPAKFPKHSKLSCHCSISYIFNKKKVPCSVWWTILECIEHNGFTVAEVRITYVAPESNNCLAVSVTCSPYWMTAMSLFCGLVFCLFRIDCGNLRRTSMSKTSLKMPFWPRTSTVWRKTSSNWFIKFAAFCTSA